jgi:hypothetical protein
MASPWTDDARPKSLNSLGEQFVDGEAVLVNAHGGEIMVLNTCAAMLWKLLDGEQDVAALVATVCAEFDVDEAQARSDVQAFLSSLADHGALER